MYWIIQNNIYSEDGWIRLTDTLDRLGIAYGTHKCIPFVGTLEPEPTPPPGPVVVMGSYTLAREAQKRGWIPGVFLNENFDYEVQYKHWGHLMFNADAWTGKLKDVPEQLNPFFIRPLHDNKAFTGYVTDWPDFKIWLEREQRQSKLYPQDGGAYFNEDTPVLVSTKKTIVREYRTWIVDSKVITMSLYKTGTWKHSEECTEDRVRSFANFCASIFCPARAFVLDIFEDNYSHLYIGEVNNLNSSGFYAADMQKLVAAIDSMEGYDVQTT